MASNRITSFRWSNDIHDEFLAEIVPTPEDDEVVLTVNPGRASEVGVQVPYDFLLEVMRVMKGAEIDRPEVLS